jgi:hypothetical protein
MTCPSRFRIAEFLPMSLLAILSRWPNQNHSVNAFVVASATPSLTNTWLRVCPNAKGSLFQGEHNLIVADS